MAIMVRNVERPDPRVIQAYSEIGVATIHESLGKETNNVMHHSIKPIARGMKLLGPAVTIDSFPADNLTVHVGMVYCKPGDVMVVNGHGMEGVMFGAQMAFQSKHSGIAGIVVDGAVRDSEEIATMQFPCFASLISPLGSAKGTPGSINVPIQCGGVLVNPGDLIVGDGDGVVVVPKKTVSETLERARKRQNKEEQDRKLYENGATSYQLNRFEEILKAKGVKQVESQGDL
jgi:4-hydroxy-4-methyl-2-oxoglutarate aldolase